MTDGIMSKAATMEIPINSNGDTGTLPEDDSLEQVGLPLQDGRAPTHTRCVMSTQTSDNKLLFFSGRVRQ